MFFRALTGNNPQIIYYLLRQSVQKSVRLTVEGVRGGKPVEVKIEIVDEVTDVPAVN